MMEQQLYVDGVLMDITEDMSITLDIKSNLFRDVTNITANNTYTINLPKTVHNLTVLEHADKPKALTNYPYNFHVCRYFRNGVEIIKNGRLTLLSVSDSIEVAIYWGLFPAFNKLQEDEVKLNTLGITNRVDYQKYNVPNTRQEAISKGIFYAYYNPYIIETKEDEFGVNFVQGRTTTTKFYTFGKGKIKTGLSRNKYIGGQVVADDDAYCIMTKFYPTMQAFVSVSGNDDYAGYAILDKNMRVVDLGAKDDKLQTVGIIAPANAAWLVCNVKASYFDRVPQLSMIEQGTIRETYISSEEDFVGDDVMAGSQTKTSPKYLQPCIMVSNLLRFIKNITGVSFEWEGTAKNYIDNLVVPIVSNNADDKTVVGKLQANLLASTKLGEISFNLSNTITAITQKSGSGLNSITVSTDCSLSFDVQIQYSVADTADGNWLQCPMYIEMKVVSYDAGTTSEQTYDIGLAKYDDGNVRFEVIRPSDKIDRKVYRLGAGKAIVQLKANDKVSFNLCRAQIETLEFELYAGVISATVSNGEYVPFGGSYPIGINLPEISVLDFVRTLSLVTGTFPRQLDDSGKVKLVQISDIWSNRDKAVDWSMRLIALEGSNTPRKSEYTISDFCRLNHYKWKEDDEVHTENDADLVVSNNTLDYERDVWTFPFAASDGNRIPIRTNDDMGARDGGEYKECQPRLMTLREDKEQAALSFDIDLQKIFATKYDKLAKSLSRAHVITEYLYLSDLEIMNFDETIPVYLAQYGAYFAVLELKVTDNGYTEATMIQLEF